MLVVFPFTSSTICELKIRIFAYFTRSYYTNSKTLRTINLLISYYRDYSKGSLGVVIMSSVRYLADSSLLAYSLRIINISGTCSLSM